MKYLNKNIEEISTTTSTKSLIHYTTSCGIFQNYDYNNSSKNKHVQR